MTPSKLMLEEDRYKWYILQYLELRKSSYVSTKQLEEVLGVSKYKLEKYFERLQQDLAGQGFAQRITIEEAGEITVAHLDMLVIKQMQIYYLKSSSKYQLFHSFISQELSLDRQIEELFLSRASIYKLFKELKVLLQEYSFQLKKNQLLGDEFRLRSFLYNFYYEAYNGIEFPFSDEIRRRAREIINRFVHFHNVQLSKTKELKLLFFTSVWLIRLHFGHFSEVQQLAVKDSPFFDYLSKSLSRTEHLPARIIRQEINYFSLFLVLEGITEDFAYEFLETASNRQAAAVTKRFVEYAEPLLLSVAQPERLTAGLLTINRRWLIYHFRDTTFISKGQIQYFQEVNPAIDAFICDFLNKLDEEGCFSSQQEKNKLYYDYLFLLVTNIAVDKIESPVHICVDFSHGEHYNRYIQEMLKSFNSVHLVIEKRLSPKTDLYLSDFVLRKIRCRQIIWKKPPTADDWRDLGRLIIKIKEKY